MPSITPDFRIAGARSALRGSSGMRLSAGLLAEAAPGSAASACPARARALALVSARTEFRLWTRLWCRSWLGSRARGPATSDRSALSGRLAAFAGRARHRLQRRPRLERTGLAARRPDLRLQRIERGPWLRTRGKRRKRRLVGDVDHRRFRHDGRHRGGRKRRRPGLAGFRPQPARAGRRPVAGTAGTEAQARAAAPPPAATQAAATQTAAPLPPGGSGRVPRGTRAGWSLPNRPSGRLRERSASERLGIRFNWPRTSARAIRIRPPPRSAMVPGNDGVLPVEGADRNTESDRQDRPCHSRLTAIRTRDIGFRPLPIRGRRHPVKNRGASGSCATSANNCQELTKI